MGRPVIATDHGGARETIVPGVTGWLVPPSDPEALAEALASALTLAPEDRFALGQRAREHVRENFDTALMTARTLDVLDQLLPAGEGRKWVA